ncbi:MAG: hypothetical protein GF330_14590 [Candidatus Eisenbacteria bacterium]|nr:hypothetical protein [Candidatus Eisenbacteria bacterium]
MRSTRTLTLLGILCCVIALGSLASATPYWGPEEVAARSRAREAGEAPPVWKAPSRPAASAGPLTRDEYFDMFEREAAFLDVWQNHVPGDPEFGGMREGEHLPDIIQTDNTSESIWVWSRYYELTGDNRYYQNIQDAFTYCMNFPAYNEEGGDSETYGYYRMYNCGWAVRAVQKYYDVYGDDTYMAYADSCASYLRHHTLIRPGPGFYGYVNPPVLSWAMGNLYWYGVRQDNAEWRAEAVRQAGEYVKAWVEEEPYLLEDEEWAMSGGATMWGLLASYFVVHPDERDDWLAIYKDDLATWATPGEHQNAWNGWYALGHWTVAEVLDDPYHYTQHQTLTDFLIAEDADLDGGIPTRPEDTDEMDQTWVANYLAYMGCDPFLAPAADAPPIASAPSLQLSAGPHPAVGDVRLRFALAQPGEVTLAIHDSNGRQVRALAGGWHAAGPHEVVWHGRDDHGRPTTSGAYYAVLGATGDRVSRPVIWLR